jgi:hypothetical protein
VERWILGGLHGMSIAGPPGKGRVLVVSGEILVVDTVCWGEVPVGVVFAGCLERTWHFVGIDEYCIRTVSRRGRN